MDPNRQLTVAQAPEPEVPQPPSTIQAEQALIGAILSNNAAYHRVAAWLTPIHFEHEIHARIFERIGCVIDGGGLAETVEWYRDNRAWWEPIKSGEYRAYYEQQYGLRLAGDPPA